jgi:hypothetical protein
MIVASLLCVDARAKHTIRSRRIPQALLQSVSSTQVAMMQPTSDVSPLSINTSTN